MDRVVLLMRLIMWLIMWPAIYPTEANENTRVACQYTIGNRRKNSEISQSYVAAHNIGPQPQTCGGSQFQ